MCIVVVGECLLGWSAFDNFFKSSEPDCPLAAVPSPMATHVAFISGPTDASEAYFAQHYESLIREAIAAGDSFIIGPVRGIDTLALHFLLEHLVPPSRITVYMAEFEYNNVRWRQQYLDLGVKVVEAVPGTTTAERDAAMTAASDYDILRYRTEEECKALYGSMWYPRVSNTEMNERRRAAGKEGRKPDRKYISHGINPEEVPGQNRAKERIAFDRCIVS